MGFNGRAYFSTSEMFDYTKYFRPNLLGGSMEYDVDLSQAGCNCNAAFYMIGMPGIGADGLPFESEDGLHYCDAAKVAGNYCPEFDIMEANTWAYRAVSHACSAPTPAGHFDWCDHPGKCAVDVIEDFPQNSIPYGPGSQYDINTNQPFHIRVDFEEDSDNEFSSYTITLTQDGREVKMVKDNCDQDLSKMTDDMKNGMTMAMSIWTSTNFDWL